MKKQSKKGVALVSLIFASCCFGVWEEKLEKSAVFSQSYRVMLGKSTCWEKSDSTRWTLSMMVAPCLWLWHERQKLDHTYSVSSPGRPGSRENGSPCLGSHDDLCCTGSSRVLSTLPAGAKQFTTCCQLFLFGFPWWSPLNLDKLLLRIHWGCSDVPTY